MRRRRESFSSPRKPRSMSSARLTSHGKHLDFNAGAASWISLSRNRLAGFRVEHDRHAGRRGNDLLQDFQSFDHIPALKSDKPVTLPPGRARLATRPVPTGSAALVMTMGMARVAFFAACAAGAPETTRRRGLRPTSSAARAGSLSNWPSRESCSMEMFRPSSQPSSLSPCETPRRVARLVPSTRTRGIRAAPCFSTAAPRRRAAPRQPRPARSAGSGGGRSLDHLIRA